MTQSPNPFQTMRGFEAPSVTQFSIFLDNKVGKLLDLIRTLDQPGGCSIRGISVIETSDHAVVRMITDNADGARLLLKDHGLVFSEIEVLVVELSIDKTLGMLCSTLLGAELNIHFMYPLLTSREEPAIALAVDDPTFGGQILRRKCFTLLGEADLNG